MRETDRQTDRQTDRGRETERDRETETVRRRIRKESPNFTSEKKSTYDEFDKIIYLSLHCHHCCPALRLAATRTILMFR